MEGTKEGVLILLLQLFLTILRPQNLPGTLQWHLAARLRDLLVNLLLLLLPRQYPLLLPLILIALLVQQVEREGALQHQEHQEQQWQQLLQ